MQLLLAEQETIIRWDRSVNEAIVYTHDAMLKRKLAEMCAANKEVRLIFADNGCVEYALPKNLISIRKPRNKSALSGTALVRSPKKQSPCSKSSASQKKEGKKREN